jgi:PAS domain S-box-containing protein
VKAPEPVIISDIAGAELSESLKKSISAEGIGGIAFIPLITDDKLIGKFMTYYSLPHHLTEEELSLAQAIARQLAIGIARKAAEAKLRDSEERFRLMSEHAQVMIWMSGAQGQCLHLNRLLRAFWAVEEEHLSRFNWQDTIHPEDAEEIRRQVVYAIARRSNFSIKARYRNADGQYRVLQTEAHTRVSGHGEFLGMIGVNVDVTEREEAERALRASELRFRLAVEAAPSGMVMTNAEGQITLSNAHLERLLGYSRDELIGQPVETLVPARIRDRHPAFREGYGKHATARPMGDGRDLFARRKDGSEIPVEIGLSPIETPDGVAVLSAIVDISRRKRAESERELLVAELNHRVKNTLAVVQAVAHQTFKTGETSPRSLKAFEGRLIALGLAHNLLTQANWESTGLRQIANYKMTMTASGVSSGRVQLDGPDVLLAPKEALAMALALHELFTNAIKYGALSNDTGRVSLMSLLEISWSESGRPLVVPPKRRGFGSLLLERTLAQDLGGEVALRFDSAGLSCRIVAKLFRSGRPQQ